MRLGARWNVGQPPHPSVPEQLHAVIKEQEAAHPVSSSWTLTWLEGRPRCELDIGLVVTVSAEGRIDVMQRAVSSPEADIGIGEDDTDDDDWLS